MKKLILMLLLVVGGVCTVNATDYYIGANINGWNIQGQMTDSDGDGTYSLIVTLPTQQDKMYFTIFTENSTSDWSKAYRPDNNDNPWITNTVHEISMLESNANDFSICYPIFGNDVGSDSYNNARAIRVEYTPSTQKLNVVRLIVVASGYNGWSTTTDYLEETECGSKIYTGNVTLEADTDGHDDGFKFVYLDGGNQIYGGKNANNYIGNDGSNYDVSVDGVYSMYAQFNDWKWTDPTLVSATASVTSVGYATFSSEYALDFSNVSGLKAYTVDPTTSGNGIVKLAEVTGKVPAATGLLLKSEGTASVDVPTTICTDVISNMLVASVSEVTLTAGSTPPYRYILGNDDTEGIGFYYVNETRTSAAGKAYLESNTDLKPATGARVSWIFEDQETTGINSVKSASLENEVYNLNGQRVNNATRGLYIVNGKKVIMK